MKRLTLRVPDELHKRLCDAAHAQGVSENTLILERLSWRHDGMTSSERNEEKEQREKNQKREENKEAKKEIYIIPRAREAFRIPTLADCEAYAAEAKLAMDVAHFYDHFTSNGWKVSGRAPMKDWRAAMRNWARRARERGFGALAACTPSDIPAHLKSWREREADAREAAEEARQMRRLESLNALLA